MSEFLSSLGLEKRDREYTEDWAVRMAPEVMRVIRDLELAVDQGLTDYNTLLHTFVENLRQPCSAEALSARLTILLGMEYGEQFHPITEQFFHHLEQTHGNYLTIVQELTFRDEEHLSAAEYERRLDDALFAGISILNRQALVTGNDNHYFTPSIDPRIFEFSKRRFLRFVDRAIHDSQSVHSYQFNTPERGYTTAQLMACSRFFYRKMIEMNLLFFSEQSYDFPYPIPTDEQLQTIANAWKTGGDTALEQLWNTKEFIDSIYDRMHTQTTGFGRSSKTIDRVTALLKENGMTRNLHIRVFGSGIIQTGEVIEGFRRNGIQCTGEGLDRLSAEMLAQHARVFEYTPDSGTPGKQLSPDALLEIIHTKLPHHPIRLDNIGEWPSYKEQTQDMWRRNNVVAMATNSSVPHDDPRGRLVAFRRMLEMKRGVLLIDGAYYPLNTVVQGILGTVVRHPDGQYTVDIKELCLDNNWTTPDKKAYVKAEESVYPTYGPKDRRYCYYPERISAELEPYLKLP